MNGYGSHIPVLEVVCDHLRARTALEYGAGNFSTPWLLQHIERLTTVELKGEWLDKVRTGLSAEAQARWRAIPTNDELSLFLEPGLVTKCDVALVDGGDYRARAAIVQVLALVGAAKAIVAHDSERLEFCYDRVWLPDGWVCVRVEGDMPWTSVFTADDVLVKMLSSKWRCTVCHSIHEIRRLPYPAIPAWKGEETPSP